MADNEEINSGSPDDDNADNPLSDEQEEALKKIMAELEGQQEEEKPSDDTEESSSESQEEDPSEGLSNEQEEALQKIMAEIESTSQSSPETADTAITAEQEDTLDKIVAELQADTPETEPEIQDSDDIQKDEESTLPDEAISEGLTSDQEDALNKIMSEIEGNAPVENDSTKIDLKSQSSQTESPSPEPTPQSDSDSQAAEPPDDKTSITGPSESEDKNNEALDLSDFETELQNVVSEANAQPSKKTPPEPNSKPASATLAEKAPNKESPPNPLPAEESIPAESENVSQEKATVEVEQPAGKKVQIAPEVPVEQQKGDPPAAIPERPKVDSGPIESSPTRQKSSENASSAVPKPGKQSGFKKIAIYLSAGIVIILLVIASIKWYPQITGITSYQANQSVSNESHRTAPDKQSREEPSVSRQLNESGPVQIRNDLLENLLSKIIAQRSILLDKLKEINDLKKYYEKGIIEIEETLIQSLRDKKITQLKTALSDQKIELGLRTIQRRKAYISKLSIPFDQVLRASEDLLYLERKATIIGLMMENTSGISLDSFEKQVAETTQRVNGVKNNLTIDQNSAPALSLQTVWNGLYAKVRSRQTNNLSSSQLAKQNQRIWKEICSGKFDQKYALTALDEKTAQCLLQWDGKDLYLNRLSHLSPEVAQILSRWQGEWLGLNGLEKLSPEAARHLARWKGKHLSLNGLTELSPKTTLYLSKWRGDQLELVGLKHIGQWENPKIELFVSDKLRRQLPQ